MMSKYSEGKVPAKPWQHIMAKRLVQQNGPKGTISYQPPLQTEGARRLVPSQNLDECNKSPYLFCEES